MDKKQLKSENIFDIRKSRFTKLLIMEYLKIYEKKIEDKKENK